MFRFLRLTFLLSAIIIVSCNNNNLNKAIQNSGSVKKLDLINQNFSDLPTDIGNLSKLTHLHLNLNNLSYLPNSFSNLSELTDLNLNNNKFAKFPEQIFSLKKLESLSLINNQIDSISSKISTLENLKYLNLANNNISLDNQEKIRTYLPNTFIVFEFEAQLKDALGYFNKAVKEYESKNLKTALYYCNKSIEIRQDIPECYSLKGFLECSLGYNSEGCKDLQNAAKLGDKQAPNLLKIYCK